MRFLFSALLAVALAGNGAGAQGDKIAARKRAPAISALRETSTIKVSVVPLASTGTLSGPSQSPQLNIGNISYGGRPVAPGVTSRRTQNGLLLSTGFGLLLQDGSVSNLRTATVRAFLMIVDSGRTYTLDGVKLTISPQVISTSVPFGIVSAHRLEIGIPASEDPGPVTNAVGFLVTAN